MIPVIECIKHPKRVIYSLLLKFGSFIPDRQYLKLIYWCKLDRMLNLDSPQRFTEKIQWLKLNVRKPEFTSLVDKILVKNIVAKIIGNQYIIPTLAYWNAAEDIKIDILPDSFVLKTTHSGGSTGVIVCKDKHTFNLDKAIHKLNNSLKKDIYPALREWPYKNVNKLVFAEKFIGISTGEDLTDFKFYCFNGIPTYCQVIRNRNANETIDFFDMNWNLMPFVGLTPGCKNSKHLINRPKKLDEMINIAKKLSNGFPFLRVDLYEVDGYIYFGELTFYPASGLGILTPDSWDKKLGDLIELPRLSKLS